MKEMIVELDTITVISRIEAVRGQQFDVYWHYELEDIEIDSIEEPTGVIDLKDILMPQVVADIRYSLNEMLSMRRINNATSMFTQEQIDTGFASESVMNIERGWANE
jgi:hypothetical protein